MHCRGAPETPAADAVPLTGNSLWKSLGAWELGSLGAWELGSLGAWELGSLGAWVAKQFVEHRRLPQKQMYWGTGDCYHDILPTEFLIVNRTITVISE